MSAPTRTQHIAKVRSLVRRPELKERAGGRRFGLADSPGPASTPLRTSLGHAVPWYQTAERALPPPQVCAACRTGLGRAPTSGRENFADIDTIFSIVVSVTLVSIHNGALWAMAHVDFDEATQTTAEEPASIHEESQCRK